MLHFYIAAYSAVISSVYFLLPLYLKGALNFSGWQIGVLYAVLSLNSLIVAFPVGVTCDRYPARILSQLGLVGMALSLGGMAGVERFWPFLQVFWAFGLSTQLFRQSLDILLYKDPRGQEVDRFGHFNAARMGGMMVGALLAGALAYVWNFPATLLIFGVLVGLLLIPSRRLPLTRGVRASLKDYGRDVLTRPVLFFITWLFLFTLHWGAEGTSLSLFLKHDLGLSPLGVGVYMAGEFGVVSATAYLYGRYWAGRLSPMAFLTVALTLSGLGHILMVQPPLGWSFIWRAIHWLGDGLILMETYTTVSRLFHVDRIGGNAGLISLATTLGVFAGSLLYGPMGAAWGYQWPLIISGITSLALVPLAWWGLKE